MIKHNKSISKYTKLVRSGALQYVLRSPIGGLASHWTFQGMLYADTTERRFKIVLDGLLTAIAWPLLHMWWSWYVALIIAFLLAHSLNFLFNAQMWVLFKNYGLTSVSLGSFEEYKNSLQIRASSEPSIQYAAIYGSVSRLSWSTSSDIDVRLVRRAGLSNGIRACLFVLLERTRALIKGFPLDIYVLDSFSPLKDMRQDENPIILCWKNKP